jgi:hypothetical protein
MTYLISAFLFFAACAVWVLFAADRASKRMDSQVNGQALGAVLQRRRDPDLRLVPGAANAPQRAHAGDGVVGAALGHESA